MPLRQQWLHPLSPVPLQFVYEGMQFVHGGVQLAHGGVHFVP